MKIEIGLNPNCSEVSFRFYTRDAKVMSEILQAVKDEMNSRATYLGLPTTCLAPVVVIPEDVDFWDISMDALVSSPLPRFKWEPENGCIRARLDDALLISQDFLESLDEIISQHNVRVGEPYSDWELARCSTIASAKKRIFGDHPCYLQQQLFEFRE